jgi:hypothetical protein
MSRFRDKLTRLEKSLIRRDQPDHIHVISEGDPDPTITCPQCKAGHCALVVIERIVKAKSCNDNQNR